MNYNKILLIISLVCLLGCQVDTTYTNRAKDRAASKKVVDEFYTHLVAQQPESAMKLISKESSSINNLKLTKIFNVAKVELGGVEKIKLDSCSTKVKEGNNASGEYLLYYTVIHEKYKTSDVFKLKLEGKEIKISDFRMNPSPR